MPTANSADIYAKMAKKVRQFGGLLISPGFVHFDKPCSAWLFTSKTSPE
jgi:hypothetical protein